MSEFSATGTIDVTVSPSSLREARGTIESELGDVQVSASNAGSSSGGSRIAGRERAMGRRLQNETNDHLQGIDTHWTENIDLNRERNDLLRDLVSVNERDAQTARGGGGLGGLAMGGVALGAGAIGLGASLLSNLDLSETISDAIDSIDIGAGDVIDTAVSLSPAALVADAATVVAGDVIDSPVNLGVGDVVDAAVGLEAEDVVAAVTLSPASVIADQVSLSPGDVVGTAATLSASDVIGTAATISPAAIIADQVSFSPGDIISGTISASAIIDYAVEGAGSAAGGAADAVGDAAGDLPMGAILGGAAGAGAGIASNIGGGLGSIGSRVASAGAPVFTPSMVNEDMQGLEGTIFDEEHFLRDTPNTGNYGAGRESRSDMGRPDPEEAGLNITEDVTVENTYQIDSLRELERGHQESEENLRQEIEDLRRELIRNP